MVYLNITFPEDLKKELDLEVRQERTKRSTLIQKAVRTYLKLKHQKAVDALLKEGYQEIKMDVLASGWNPNKFILKKDIPVKWVIDGKEINGCNNAIQVPAYNLDKPNHKQSSKYLGYILTINNKRIYHAGDTDLIPEMNSIEADIALLPVSGKYVMDPEEAANAANLIRPEVAIPMHYGSVIGSKEDAEKFKSLVDEDIQVIIF